jgi:hypothetical protein
MEQWLLEKYTEKEKDRNSSKQVWLRNNNLGRTIHQWTPERQAF